MPVESADDAMQRNWEERKEKVDAVRKKLRNGWRNDPKVLQEYFESCVTNWKTYKGERNPKMVLRLQGIYRQAIHGDCNIRPPSNLKSVQGVKWTEWDRLRGTSQTVAKRRFITFMSEINPTLIDVMPSEKPPPGFPHDELGNAICAKCNTAVGCARPLLDQFGIDLRQQLFESEHLHEPENLRAWVKNAMQNQRCIWGVHKAISKIETRAFEPWFTKSENGGFEAYDATSVISVVRDLLIFAYEVCWDFQCHREEYGSHEFNKQSAKVAKLSTLYREMSGEEYIFYVPCDRMDDPLCNDRRLADNGRNHKHQANILPPTQADEGSCIDAIALRLKCQELGLRNSTGVVSSVTERCNIYRERIADYEAGLIKQDEARLRNDERTAEHQKHKKQVAAYGKIMSSRQTTEAAQANDLLSVIQLLGRNADPNCEGSRGMTPLICAVQNSATPEQVEVLRLADVNMNYVNKHGMTGLMIAVRRKDAKMMHLLMRNGGTGLVSSGKNGMNRNAMHWAAVHGAEEEAKILYEYVKEGGGDSLRLNRLLDSQDSEGNTPLMIASIHRDGIMARCLQTLGANPNLRNKKARTAAYLARHAGWAEVADWLDTKVGAGVAKLETHGDVTFERQCRFSSLKLREMVHSFGFKFLTLVQGGQRINQSPLGPPSIINDMRLTYGDKCDIMLQGYADDHNRLIHTHHGETDWSEEEGAQLKEIKVQIREMEDKIRQGFGNPNVEAQEKPLPWTILMCAAACNDVRACKIFMKEGADPNYPNMHGTTAVMIAAQLNNLEALVELLIGGGDPEGVDSEGYTPMAYASSFPQALRESRDAVSVILDGDTDGAKRMTSQELLKMAIQYGPGTLRIVMKENVEETAEVKVEGDYNLLRLLERNGLTRIDTSKQMSKIEQSAYHRISVETIEYTRAEDESETSSEAGHRMDLEAYQRELKEEAKENTGGLGSRRGSDGMRCPICTLSIPCTHFFREDALRKHLQQQALEDAEREEEMKMRGSNAAAAAAKDGKNNIWFDKGSQVLREAKLDDRKTDRSQTLSNKYRTRELKLQKERVLKRELAIQRARMEEEGIWKEWEETEDVHGLKTYTSNVTGDIWKEYLDSSTGKNYYHCDLLGKTRWEDPRTPEETEEEKAVRLAEEAEEAERLREEEERKKRPTFPRQLDDGTWQLRSAMKGARKILLEDAAQYASNPKRAHKKVKEQLEKLKAGLSFRTPDDENEEHENREMQIEEELMATFLVKEEVILRKIERLRRRQNGEDEDEEEEVPEPTEEEVRKAKAAERKAALKAKKGGGFSGGGTDNAEALIGRNPVPPQDRGVMMFTEDYFGRRGKEFGEAGLPGREREAYGDEHQIMLLKDHGPEPLPPGHKKKKKRKKGDPPPPLDPVQVSGWLFTALCGTFHGTPPLTSLRMQLEVWGDTIEGLREKFINEWLPRMMFESVTDIKSWQPMCGRCTACGVGFSRMDSNFSDQDWGHEVGALCLPCMSRKEMFERARITLPRAFRRNIAPWPFKGQAAAGTRPESPGAHGAPGSPKMLPYYNPDGTGALLPGASALDTTMSLVQSTALIAADMHEAEEAARETAKFKKGYKNAKMKSAFLVKDKGEYDAYGNEIVKEKDTTGIRGAAGEDGDWQNDFGHSGGKLDGYSLASTEDSASIKTTQDKGPREMTLIPFLIAKGHYGETERVIRVALDKPSANEGEGLLVLNKLLGFQAEMYKMMGLFPLALGILMDCADMMASLMGYCDSAFHTAVCQVCALLRLMKAPLLIKRYLENICDTMTRVSNNPVKGEEAATVVEADRKYSERFSHPHLWRAIKRKAPEKSEKRRLWHMHGLGGLYNLFTTSQGHCVAARVAFLAYVEADSPDDMAYHARFVIQCFRMRLCENDEIYRYIVTSLTQKHVPKRFESKSPVARNYYALTDRYDLEKVDDFLHQGTPLELEVFDMALEASLVALEPTYRRFFYSQEGALLRTLGMDVDAEIATMAATKIQTILRIGLAKHRFKKVALMRGMKKKKVLVKL